MLEEIKKAWTKFKCDSHNNFTNYNRALSLIKGIDYAAVDVGIFSIILAEFQDEKSFSKKTGIFLSALINNGADTDYVVNTLHLRVEIGYIGLHNTKNIVINGNSGGGVGFGMQRGKILVNRHGGDEVGEAMEGGVIIVNGNVGRAAGIFMKNGRIVINGGATDDIGVFMRGGVVHLNGNYVALSNAIRGGRIYYKDKIVYPID